MLALPGEDHVDAVLVNSEALRSYLAQALGVEPSVATTRSTSVNTTHLGAQRGPLSLVQVAAGAAEGRR